MDDNGEAAVDVHLAILEAYNRWDVSASLYGLAVVPGPAHDTWKRVGYWDYIRDEGTRNLDPSEKAKDVFQRFSEEKLRKPTLI